MKTGLTRKDWAIIGFLFLFAIVSGFAGEAMGWEIEIDSTDFWQALLPALASAYFIYRTEESWGGKILRHLSIIGLGLFMHAVLWGVIVQWHIAGTPALLGLTPAAVYVLLHGLSAVAFMMTAYGFYLSYRFSRERSSP